MARPRLHSENTSNVMLTFYDCQTDRGIVAAAHCDPTSDEFAERLNEAARRLMDYGDWWATVDKLVVPSYNNTIVWPYYVGTPLALRDYRGPMVMRSEWANFIPFDREDWKHIGGCYPNCREYRCELTITDVGTSPVRQNIPAGMSNYILFYPRNPLDKGRTVTIFGIASTGQPVSETLVMPHPALDPFVASTNKYQRILRVLKDRSSDYLDAYQCSDNTPGTLLDLSHYAPSETRPEYRVSHIQRYHSTTQTATAKYYQALVKLQHIDAFSSSDIVLPGNRAALKLMLYSIHKEEASDPKGAEADSMRAIHELNRELNNRLPEFQIPVSYEEFGGANMRRHSAF